MGEEAAAAMAALQQQCFEMKDEIIKLRRKNMEEKDDMEEDNDAWMEEQPGSEWQELLKAAKLPAAAPAAKLLSTLMKDAPLFDLAKNTEKECKISAGSRHASAAEVWSR